MNISAFFEKWVSVVSLILFSAVWASLQWDVHRGLITEGLSAVDTLSDVDILVMLLITLRMTVNAVRQTLTVRSDHLKSSIQRN